MVARESSPSSTPDRKGTLKGTGAKLHCGSCRLRKLLQQHLFLHREASLSPCACPHIGCQHMAGDPTVWLATGKKVGVEDEIHKECGS